MLSLPFKALAVLGLGGLLQSGSLGRADRASYEGPRSLSFSPQATETTQMSDPQQLELIRSFASSGFAAVITINSGALVAGLSQAGNLPFVSPMAIASALFIWALGVTTGVATWGAAYHATVALTSCDQEADLRWRRIATGLFHFSLAMFLLGFIAIGLSALG